MILYKNDSVSLIGLNISSWSGSSPHQKDIKVMICGSQVFGFCRIIWLKSYNFSPLWQTRLLYYMKKYMTTKQTQNLTQSGTTPNKVECILAIPAPQRLNQWNSVFETSLGYMTRSWLNLGMVVHICSPSTQESKTGGSV